MLVENLGSSVESYILDFAITDRDVLDLVYRPVSLAFSARFLITILYVSIGAGKNN